MRTEDDLRTALISLEQHAPVAARVLPGIASPHRTRRGLRSPLALRWVAGIAVTAAVAGAITGVTLTGGAARTNPNGSVAASSANGSTSIQAKLLAAFSAHVGDIAYARMTMNTTSGTSTTANVESWIYPWQPSSGQQVRYTEVVQSGGRPVGDVEWIYKQPARGSDTSTTRYEEIAVDFDAKVWSDSSGEGIPGAVRSDDGVSFPDVTRLIKERGLREIGTGSVDGHHAIEFRAVSGSGTSQSTYHLWVDVATYLPLRLDRTFSVTDLSSGNETKVTDTADYQLMPATPANLAKLTPPIPAGFRKRR